ncbi:MAG: enoyl-CoA hydratase/isomerase family protein [Thermoplasmatota archaeon]
MAPRMDVVVTRAGPVAVVTLGREEAMNSFDPEVIRAVRQAFSALLADDGVRALVLTGSGRAFSTGADVRAFRDAIRDGTAPEWVLRTTAELHPLLLDLQRSAKPFVAAVNGVAAGGGLGLALVADVRIGTAAARFAAGYFALGLSPDGGSTWLLPRLIGERRSRSFFFGNEVMGADEALRFGLLDEIVDPGRLLPRAIEVAQRWGAWGHESRQATKVLLASAFAHSFAEQLELERGLISAAAGGPDFRSGVEAFLGKSKPQFR